MGLYQRKITLDNIRQLDGFIVAKKKLLSDVETTEVRELLQVQIEDLQRRRKEVMSELSVDGGKRLSETASPGLLR
jgi:hypothetical protein